MSAISLVLLTTPGCKNCKMFKEFWHSIEKDWKNVSYRELDIVSSDEGQKLASEHMVLASPGILLNGDLFATGGFDKGKFISRLKELSEL